MRSGLDRRHHRPLSADAGRLARALPRGLGEAARGRLRRALPPSLGLLPLLLGGGLPRAPDRRRPGPLRQAGMARRAGRLRDLAAGAPPARRLGCRDEPGAHPQRQRRSPAARPRAGRHAGDLGPADRAACRRARGDRGRHAGVRRLARAARRGGAERRQPGGGAASGSAPRSASSARTSPATPSAPGSGWRWGAPGLRRLGHRALPRRPLAPPTRAAAHRHPPRGRRGCGRWSPRALGTAAGRRRIMGRRSPPTRSGSRPTPPASSSSAGSTPTATTAANRAMRTHVFDPAGYPEDVPVTIAWGELDRLVGPPRRERRPAGVPLPGPPGLSATPQAGTTRSC